MAISEAKHQRGACSLPIMISGFEPIECLRPSSATGGIIVWIKKGSGKAVRRWESTAADAPTWMSSERVWILMEDEKTKVACCAVYMRVNSPINSDFHKQNKELLDQITEEIREIRGNGYVVNIIGDFNARVSANENFNFVNYPHHHNENGTLLMNFAAFNDLYCLNPMTWNGRATEVFTFQRDLGVRVVRSLIDYSLGCVGAVAITSSFKVSDEAGIAIESDHSTLVWRFNMKHAVDNPVIKQKNILRYIKNWDVFKQILEDRLANRQDAFKEMTVAEQERFLVDQMKKVGSSVCPGKQSKKEENFFSSRLRSILEKKKRVRATLKRMDDQNSAAFQIQRKKARELAAEARKQHFHDSLKKKKRMKALLSSKSKRAQKLFWSILNKKPRGSSSIEALVQGGRIITCPRRMNAIIEQFFQVKFNTTFKQEEVKYDNIPEVKLGIPEKSLSDSNGHEMMSPVTPKELDDTINSLQSDKAEGQDGITNEMLKNTGVQARKMILDMFNNIMAGGLVPPDWKVGDVVLVLKKPPQTDVSNYRPITLISCVSKLLTKILAKRLSAAVDKEDIIGPEQNGFRASRSCSDNIFILNTILEINKSKKLLSHLLFVDLKEAYDRVDRGILLQKLRQLNIPKTFINFLENYYFLDNISTEATGIRTAPQYQKRGLRQGCNLSSVLFILYLSELSRRMRESGIGARLPDGSIVNILLFADDIIILGRTTGELEQLRGILEGWCEDFRMTVSAAKTNVISPDKDYVCQLNDRITKESEIIGHVSSYKYLGIHQFSTNRKTASYKGETMISKANMYKDVILRTTRDGIDQIMALSTLWINVALPAILYGVEAVPVSEHIIQQLELIQTKLGKSVLRIPYSSANTIIYTELGWKPIRLQIAAAKLRFFKRVEDSEFKGSQLVKTSMEWNKGNGRSLYITNLQNLLAKYREADQELKDITMKQIHLIHQLEVQDSVQKLVSLRLTMVPTRWWKPTNFLTNSRCSNVMTRFKCMNVGLGNRDAYRSAEAIAETSGRVLLCPLCLNGKNNEIHIALYCKSLAYERSIIQVGSSPLSSTLDQILQEQGVLDEVDALRKFLGDRKMTKTMYLERGLALDILVDTFFKKWSAVSGRHMDRRIVFNWI